jgi:hypothetical protein
MKGSVQQEPVLDYDYVCFDKNAKALSKELVKRISKTEGRPSVNNILRVLKQFEEIEVKSWPYMAGGSTNAPVIDKTGKFRPRSLVQCIKGRVFVHSSLLFNVERGSGNIVKDILLEMQYTCTRPGEYLLGTVYRDPVHHEKKHTHFDVIRLTGSKKVFQKVNARKTTQAGMDLMGIADDDMARRQILGSDSIPVTCFLDDYTRYKHHKKLGWTCEPGGKDEAKSRHLGCWTYLKQQRLALDKEAFKNNRVYNERGRRHYPSEVAVPIVSTDKRKYADGASLEAKKKKV